MTKATKANNSSAPVKAATSVKTPNTKTPTSPTKTTAKAATTAMKTKSFALTDVTVASVQLARQLRKSDPDRFTKFRNYFVVSDATTAAQFNTKNLNPEVLACIQEIQLNQQDAIALITVSAAIAKYGEQELVRRDTLGEMDNVVGSRFGTNGLRSKMQIEHSVGASFVLRMALGVAPEKRAGCQRLRDIVAVDSNSRLVLTLSNKGLKPVTTAAGKVTDKISRDRLQRIAKQAQSTKFQDAMLQVGGQYIYDAIRTLVKKADASVWDASKDKSALQTKNIRPRSNSGNTKMDSPRKQLQSVKKVGTPNKQEVKKYLPVEVKTSVVVPPPAPTIVKNSSPVKNAAPVKNASPMKNTAPVKNVSPVKGAMTLVMQPRPTAVVNGTSSITSGSRTTKSRTTA